jgi:hypothetical protein
MVAGVGEDEKVQQEATASPSVHGAEASERAKGNPSLHDGTDRSSNRDLGREPSPGSGASRRRRSRLGEDTGPFFDSESLTALLGVSAQVLEEHLTEGNILACHTTDDHRVYPAWQFDGDGNVYPGIAEVVRAFKEVGLDGWTAAKWLKVANPELGGLPALRLLAEGERATVIQAARRDADRFSH